MRVESLATTDFFQTLLERQRNLNELSDQLCRTRSHTPSTCTRSSAHTAQGSVCYSMAREWWFDVRPKGVEERRPYLIEELSVPRALSPSTRPMQRRARWYEAFKSRCTCITVNQSVRESSPSATKPRPKGPRRSGVDPMRAGEVRRCPRSECRSVGRHCFARNSRKARDAEGCPVGREHGRVRSRMTGLSPLGAVKGAQNTDGHFDIDSDVWVTSQPCFPEREDGAVALASRAQESPRKHRSPPRRRNAKQKHRQATRIAC